MIPFSIRAEWSLQGSSSWPLRVDATDLCCLRDLMMMMTIIIISLMYQTKMFDNHYHILIVRHAEARYCFNKSVCLSICPFNSGIVSKRIANTVRLILPSARGMNDPSFWTLPQLWNSKGKSVSVGRYVYGVGNFFFYDFRPRSSFISETVLDRPADTIYH